MKQNKKLSEKNSFETKTNIFYEDTNELNFFVINLKYQRIKKCMCMKSNICSKKKKKTIFDIISHFSQRKLNH